MEHERVSVVAEDVNYVEYTERNWVYYILLRDGKQRHIAIFLSQDDLSEIALAVKGVVWTHPFASDAMLACITTLGANVEESCIHGLKEDVYQAHVTLRSGDQVTVVEMRPSDAIPLALRAKSPIYIHDEVAAHGARLYEHLIEGWSKNGLHPKSLPVAAQTDATPPVTEA